MDIKRAEKCFANHKATLTDYGNIKILDFKNPKSSEYRIRFLFEEDYCRLHISGDLGELTATNYYNMTYEKFSDMVRDVGYFEGKINCHSRPLYIYDEDAVKEDVLELIKEMYGLEELIEDYRNYDFYSNEEVLEEFYDDILSDFSDSTGISSEARKILAKYIGEYDAYSDDIGKRKTDILDWYMFAFQLAQKQLNDDNAEIKTHPAVETEKYAHWIKHKPNEEQMKAYHELGFGKAMDVKSTYWTCSNCNCWGTPVYKYCSNCGRKMKKVKENNKIE